MHRIDAPGFAPGNLFTEGNPALGIPATEVSDDWLNAVQEEVATFIEGEGITLDKPDNTQLAEAIFNAIGAGGTNIKLDPLANNTADQVVTGLIFDKADVKAAVMFFDVHRETASSNVQETGILTAVYDPLDDVWRISLMVSSLDDAGTTFNITGTGQIRATTDDLVGASYDGQLRVTGIFRFAQ